jgi:hypothetical protein
MVPSIKIAGKQTVLTYTLQSIRGLHSALEQVFELLRRSGDKYEFLQHKRATNITVEENPEDQTQIRMEFILPVRIADMSLSEQTQKQS